MRSWRNGCKGNNEYEGVNEMEKSLVRTFSEAWLRTWGPFYERNCLDRRGLNALCRCVDGYCGG